MQSNRTVTQIRAAAGCALAALAAVAPAQAKAAGPRLDKVEREALREINAVRHSYDLPRLKANRALDRSADYHCRDMLAADFFAHESSNGQSFAQRVERYRHSRRIGETLAEVPPTSAHRQARRIVRMWMNSPPHRASLLSRSFRRIGIARRHGRLYGSRVVVFTADLASAH